MALLTMLGLAVAAFSSVALYRWLEERRMPRAVCFLLVREDGKILAVSRKRDRTRFGLPGGKVEPGETWEQALAREVLEETGLTVHEPRQIFRLVCRGRQDYVAKAYFAGRVTGELHTDEPIDIRYVDAQVLLDGPFGEYNRKLFRKVGIT